MPTYECITAEQVECSQQPPCHIVVEDGVEPYRCLHHSHAAAWLPVSDPVAITVQPPYARFIVEGLKMIEIRSRRTTRRGSVLIHAGAKVHKDYRKHVCSSGFYTGALGAIIGQVTISDVWRIDDEDAFERLRAKHMCPSGSFKSPCFAWEMVDPVEFDKPIPYKGRLGFFKVPQELVS